MSNVIDDANRVSSFDEILDEFYRNYEVDTESMFANSSINNVLNSFEGSVFSFNATAGNFESLNEYSTIKSTLNKQAALILEEVKETIEAESYTDMLDGVVDVLVTAFGYAQMLEHLGIDVAKAMMLVAENNLSKFTKSQSVAEDTVAMYKEKGVMCEYKKVDGVYVIKDENGKVRKPIDYVPVDLTSCLL